MAAGLEEPAPQPGVQVAQALVSLADGGELLRVVFGREPANELEVTAADRLVVALGGDAQHLVRVAHDGP